MTEPDNTYDSFTHHLTEYKYSNNKRNITDTQYKRYPEKKTDYKVNYRIKQKPVTLSNTNSHIHIHMYTCHCNVHDMYVNMHQPYKKLINI